MAAQSEKSLNDTGYRYERGLVEHRMVKGGQSVSHAWASRGTLDAPKPRSLAIVVPGAKKKFKGVLVCGRRGNVGKSQSCTTNE